MKKRSFLLLLPGLIFFLTCCVNRIPNKKKDNIEGINFYSLVPDVFAKDINNFSIDSITAVKINDYVIYLLPPIISRINGVLIHDSTTAKRIFIYEQGKKYGYYYDSLNSNNRRKALVDSFLTMYTTVDKNPFSKNDSIIESNRISKNILTEKYVPRVKDINSYDTFFVVYDDRLKESYFSLSKAGDSITKKKIIKFGFLINENKDNKRRLFYWEINADRVCVNKHDLEFFIKKHNDWLIGI